MFDRTMIYVYFSESMSEILPWSKIKSNKYKIFEIKYEGII